ncbi:MAG: type II toxin-antitoxin system mRNA interferase toxin, RelE/StbE family [Myxacorys chilensis ATA2-1-KO14]|jgi:addiction module RelE/StbE family toxin|nr:type II toxin-antitoxin system mRNA interferase toxin, RelE/StbE family [Myxacorys chilensis ATA2-1-KO14]
MRTLIFDESFRRALRKRGKKRPELRVKVTKVLSLLEVDPFNPSLKTHKLQGELEGLWSCSVEYDCRIIFRFEALEEEEEDAIVLIDIGNHDEVY